MRRIAPDRRPRLVPWILAAATTPCLFQAATPAQAQAAQARKAGASTPTAKEAAAFVAAAEERLLALSNAAGRAQWVQSTYITDDTEKIAAEANKNLIAASMELAKAATRFDPVAVAPEVRRKLSLLKLSANPLPAPGDPKLQTELTEIMTGLEGTYGRGKYCKGPDAESCLDVGKITKIMAEKRDADELKDVWRGWHAIAPPMMP
jgi:peptidyl-dipeptidase A